MKTATRVLVIVMLCLAAGGSALATNGDNLIAIGPIERAMGGVGVAHPMDAIGAVFSNPAAMCFGEYCPSSEANFNTTFFMPKTEAKVKNFAGSFKGDSDSDFFVIPALGMSLPIGQTASNWRFGLAAYGVSGLGVDYRDTDIDQGNFFGPGFPLVAGTESDLQIMKISPAVAFQPSARFSVGLGLHVDYATLDLGDGSSEGWGLGFQAGLIYNPTDQFHVGLTYISPQEIDHDDVTDFDGDGRKDDLTLERPQQAAVGLAYSFLDDRMLIETDVRWINWSDAEGYDDFDWDDQWVFAVGAQYEVVSGLYLRCGYNYAENPVNEHNGWDGSINPGTGSPNEFVNVQGKNIPRYYYETFRTIGFPAIVEHHVTAGVGYVLNESWSFNIGFMHAFENTITEEGTDFSGQPTQLKSTLSENSVDVGVTWRF